MWLDRGELDKIVDHYDAYDREEERANYEDYQRREQPVPRRRSFWQELFD